MKKSIIIPLAAVLCLSLLAGCNAKDSSTPPNSKQANTSAQATVTSSDTSDAYEKLVAFKTANYEQQSVADFNQSLAPDNGDISGLLDAQAEVLASISPDDENYEFITMTLAASLDELYCEQMNDSVGLSAYLKREERPLEKLPGEESVAGAEICVEVSDEIVEAFLLDKRAEAARDRKMFRYKAFYSLDCNDGIENAAIGWAQPSPEDHLIEKEELAEYEELIRRLYEAISSLPSMQARRVHARYMLGMKVKDIAAMEGITPSQAGKSIHAALRRLRRYFARQKWTVNL